MKIEFLTSMYRITLELVTEWNLDPDNSRKYFFFPSKFCFLIDMCINSVKETCFSQKYQKWICSILELNSSIMAEAVVAGLLENINSIDELLEIYLRILRLILRRYCVFNMF